MFHLLTQLVKLFGLKDLREKQVNPPKNFCDKSSISMTKNPIFKVEQSIMN